KCLEKEPAKRYRSAEALAWDLGHYLAKEPIEARPVGKLERAVKWARRRPAAAASLFTSAVATLALVGLGVGLWYNKQLQTSYKTEEKLRQVADSTRALAETARSRARRFQYAANMNQAHRAWQEGEISRTLEILEEHRPKQ